MKICSSFQVFLDVVESVNILVNSNGQIIRSDVVGALKMRTYLRCVFWKFGKYMVQLREYALVQLRNILTYF